MTRTLAAFAAMFVMSGLGSTAHAQEGGDIHVARAEYRKCKALANDGQPCEALESCEAGLTAKRMEILLTLTEEVREACEERERSARKACPKGKVRNEDTADRCCWPGQAWNGERCVGTPTLCPEGLEIDAEQQSCARPQSFCDEEGRILTPNGGCCWPEQAWLSAQERCVGPPQCPETHQQSGETCVRRPESDRDADGIQDHLDACPAEPEDLDQFQDEDGCPEPDNDGDTICDAWVEASNARFAECKGIDLCGQLPEDFDQFQDEDGCPEPDNDRDQICDPWVSELPSSTHAMWNCAGVDACIDTPETVNDFEDEDGCPDTPPPVVEDKPFPLYTTLGWSSITLGLLSSVGGALLISEATSRREQVLGRGENIDDVITDLRQADVPELEAEANLMEGFGIAGLAVGGGLITTGILLLVFNPDTEGTVITTTLAPDRWLLSLKGRF